MCAACPADGWADISGQTYWLQLCMFLLNVKLMLSILSMKYKVKLSLYS